MEINIKRLAVVCSIVLLPLTAYAYQVSVTVDGASYSCSGGDDSGNNSTCVQKISDLCYRKTSYNHEQCFQKSSAYCPGSNYASCVEQTEDYCYRTTSHNHDQCFDLSLGTCRGNFKSIEKLSEGVRQSQLLIDQGGNLELSKASQPAKKK